MDYLKFKNIHERQFGNLEYSVVDIANKNSLKQSYHILQSAFDKIFKSIADKRPSELPIWLFDLFDKFVKLVENTKSSIKRRWSELLILFKELHFNTHLKLGPVLAEQLYGRKNSASAANAIAA